MDRGGRRKLQTYAYALETDLYLSLLFYYNLSLSSTSLLEYDFLSYPSGDVLGRARS